MTAILRFTFALIIASLPLQLALAGELIIDEPLERQSLASHLSYITDDEQILYIGHIADEQFAGKWQPYIRNQRPTYLLAGAHWFKTRLENRLDHDVTLLIELEYPSIDIADMYQVDSQFDIDVLYTNAGLNKPYLERPTFHRNIINKITIPADSSTTLLWRLESDPLFEFKLTAWNPDTFAARDQHEQLFNGILYGILLIMAGYNFFLFLSTRETSYVYYVLYALTSTYLLAAQSGHVYQYIAVDSAWSKSGFYAIAYALNALFFAKFAISFLKLRQHYRRLARLVWGSAIITAICTMLVTATGNFHLIVMTLAALTTLYIAVLVAGIRIRLLGVISAGHFVLAIMVLVLALVVTNMMTVGLVPRTDTTESLLPLGMTTMLLFFSLALADRINQLQKDNAEAIQGLELANDEKIKASHELIKAQRTRVRLENEANQAQMESHAKSDFLATISHEIRTPMNGMLGMAELLKSTTLDNKQNRYVGTIQQSGRTLLAIINDLLDYAKIEAGKMELDIHEFNLEMLLDDCIATFTPRASEKKLNFVVDLDPAIDPVLKGDTTKLRQIILNLLSNAFKFTDHGDVILRVTTTRKEAINGVELRFEVQDSGIGLSKDEQQRLFKPFRQTDAGSYGPYGGSGLGLAICKQLAELMDGKIGVVSDIGQGATFWFTSRLLIDKTPNPLLLRPKSTSLRDKRLLLVESDTVSADIIERLLSHWGLQVIVAENSSAAVAAIAEDIRNGLRYDIILANQTLNGHGDGLELAQILHDESKHKVWSYILMCPSQQVPQQADLTQANVDGVLERPMTFALLHDVLCQAIMPTIQLDDSPALPEDSDHWADKNILLVEDNQVNQMVMIGLLEKFKIKPVLAINGLEALEHYDQQNFDLIFMDCDMPEMDGFEAAKQIRGKEATNDKTKTPIVALSSHIREGHESKIAEAGIDHYISKPIGYNDVLNVLLDLK
jgi:signal transduction histidine kinase/DNA-binding response OmpR family regulator